MKFEFSAGGVVYRRTSRVIPAQAGIGSKKKILDQVEDEIQVLVAQHSQHHGWVFPKGLIGDKKKGETKESTAVREVEEETGIRATIEHPLTPISFWYQFEGEKRKKTVYYFVMKYLSGDTSHHDFEMEKVEWLSVDEVEERLTFPSEKGVWREAREYIESRM